MTEIISDLRGHPNANVLLAQASLHAAGFVVASDSDPIGLDPRFRSDVLPEYAGFLREDIYPIPPQGRLRADGLADYAIAPDGSVRLTRDYEQVAIPVWSGNRLTAHRLYANGLPIMDHPVARKWLESVIALALHDLPTSAGSVGVHYFETGHEAGKIVEGRHQDGELLVGSFPAFINGEGAETSLDRPIAPIKPSKEALFERVATFRLGIGDLALSNDVALWHSVSPLTPPSDGTEPRRRSFVLAIHAPRTNEWLQHFYAGSPHRHQSGD
jgi:hypothetical protein